MPGGYLKRLREAYDRSLCLIPRDAIDFILATQPKEWKRPKEHHGAEVRERFLKRLASEIERRGALDVLRKRVKDSGCQFKLVYFRPASGLNEELQRLHAANLFAVVRQQLGPAACSGGHMALRSGIMTQRKALAFERSSGNVFADLGFEHPEEELAKAQLILQIVTLIQARGLTQTAAARLLGLPQPKVSLLYRGQVAGFSTDRLIRFLNRLDQNVEIVIRPKPTAQRAAHVRVVRRGPQPAQRRMPMRDASAT